MKPVAEMTLEELIAARRQVCRIGAAADDFPLYTEAEMLEAAGLPSFDELQTEINKRMEQGEGNVL